VPTTLLVQVAGSQLSDDDLATLADVTLEEATDQADAATLVAKLTGTPDGEWTSVLDPLVTPRTPVVVQVAHDDVTYRFDGYSTEAAWSIDAKGASTITVKAIDRTVAMTAEEKVAAWPGMTDSAIVSSVLSSYGLTPQVEDTPAGPDPDVHVMLQRGTDWAFVRSLARKWGYAAYLEASDTEVVGHFHPVDPLADPQGELALGFGGDAYAVEVRADLLAGESVTADRIPALSDSAQNGTGSGDDEAQGATSLGGQVAVLLAPADVDGEVDPTETAGALARRSAFGVTLTADVETDRVGVLFRARRPALVKGLGSTLSGRYLVSTVRHSVSLSGHAQHLTLTRNALGVTGDEPFGGGGLGGLL
jgi:hypothetical protein